MATQGELHLQFWMGKLQRRSFVYVIQGDPGTPVKIGMGRDPLKRLATLQTGSWQTLRLLHILPGGRQLEATLHRRLRDARVSGEWFHGSTADEVVRYIEETAEKMVADCKGSGVVGDVVPGMRPGSNEPEPAAETQARWRRISDRWLAGEDRRTIRLREDLTETQFEVEILRMRENGYELASGLQLLEDQADGSTIRTGNFRHLGRSTRRAA